MLTVEQDFQQKIDDLSKYFASVKKIEAHSQCVFLSKRFLNVYRYLTKKYPEITFSNFCLKDDITDTKSRKIYLNDINYEFPKKVGLRDKIIIHNSCFEYAKFANMRSPLFTEKDRQIVLNRKKLNRQLKHHIKWGVEVVTRQALDLLGIELKLLEDNKVSDPIALLPNFLQNYFRFIIKNQEYLKFYLKAYHTGRLFSYDATDSATELLSKVIIDDMIQIYGKENLSAELIKFLSNSMTIPHYDMAHYPISQLAEAYENYTVPYIEDGKVERIAYRKEGF